MDIFKNRTYLMLFMANFTSLMGTTIGHMAFAFYLLDRFSKQPYYATIAEMMYTLPILLVFFLVGVIADRFDRKKIAENTDWIRAGLTVLLFIAVFNDAIFFSLLLLFMRSCVAKFFAPAESGLIQGILTKDQYMQASGLNQSVGGIFMLFGVGMAAAAYAYLGIEGAVIIDAVSFVISALLIRFCHIDENVKLPNGKTKVKDIRFSMVLQDFKEGITYILSNRLLLSIILGFFIFGFINGGFSVLPMFTMKYMLAPDHYTKYMALFSVCLGLGFLGGSALSTGLAKKFQPHQIIITCLLLSSIATGLLALMNNPWIFLSIVFISGVILAPLNIAFGGWMPSLVDPAKMGRVSAWIEPLMMLSQTIALGVIALIYPKIASIASLYYGLGALMFIAFLYYALVLPKMSRAHGDAVENENAHAVSGL